MTSTTILQFRQKEQATMTASETGIHSLAYYRRWKLLTQRELGERAGVTGSTVSFIETGRTVRPRLLVMRKLCLALGVPAERIAEFRQELGYPVEVQR